MSALNQKQLILLKKWVIGETGLGIWFSVLILLFILASFTFDPLGSKFNRCWFPLVEEPN